MRPDPRRRWCRNHQNRRLFTQELHPRVVLELQLASIRRHREKTGAGAGRVGRMIRPYNKHDSPPKIPILPEGPLEAPQGRMYSFSLSLKALWLAPVGY